MNNTTKISGFILIGLLLLLIFSPYKYDKALKKKTIMHQLSIDVEKSKLFNYLGNSKHAKYWSDFVDHIVVTNTPSIKDGQVGSIRRCFKNENEKGLRWDEKILEVIPDYSRTLNCFNLNGFPMQTDGILTQQVYKELHQGNTLLEFNVSFKDKTIWDNFKIRLGAWYVKYIFKANMRNIKTVCEKLNQDGAI